MNANRVVLGKEARTLYSATKDALQVMACTWALEIAADGITVNCVAPGLSSQQRSERTTRQLVRAISSRTSMCGAWGNLTMWLKKSASYATSAVASSLNKHYSFAVVPEAPATFNLLIERVRRPSSTRPPEMLRSSESRFVLPSYR